MKSWIFGVGFGLGLVLATPVMADELLIRGATVHPGDGTAALAATDVHVRDGRIVAVGKGLAVGSARLVEAQGRPLTPGLFGGLTALGLEEVSLEASTVDNAMGGNEPDPAAVWRPEFDVSLAFNPASSVIPVNRVEGVTFPAIAPTVAAGAVLNVNNELTLNGRWQFRRRARSADQSIGPARFDPERHSKPVYRAGLVGGTAGRWLAGGAVHDARSGHR